MVDTLTLNNDGTAAWEVTTFSGTGITTQIGVTNPDIELTSIGTRYEITNDGYPDHPLEFLDDQDNVLLSQSTTGSFESDSGVNWVDNDTSVEFTLTQGLSNQLTTYRCTVHTGAMVGNIISPEIDYTPDTGSVSITSPSDGDVVTSPFDVVMEATDFTIEAASNGASDGAGHFHILVDQDAIAAGEAIPNDPDNGYYHYGDGSTTATLDLDPGAYTIRIQAGTANHLAYDLTDSVDIIVESDIQGTPIINAIDNVNQTSLDTVFAAVAADPTARDNFSQSDRNIDAMSTSVAAIEALNNNEDAVLRVLCRREGRDPANFADLDAVAADVSLVQDLSVREVAIDIITSANKAHNAISENDRATREMMCHPAGLDATTFTNVAAVASDNVAMTTIAADAQASRAMAAVPSAMQEVIGSQIALDEVLNSQTAMQGVIGSQVALDEVVNSQTAMQEVIGSQLALDEVLNSQKAMREVAASETAMQEVAASQTAMEELADSQTAMQEVAASQTAVAAIGSNDNKDITADTLLNSSTATQEFLNSPLLQRFERTFNAATGAAGTLTSSRVLVTSNNNNGDRNTGISFSNDVGPQTESGSTFIINGANSNNYNNNLGGSVGFDGIVIN